MKTVIMYREGFQEVYQTDPAFAVYPNIRHSACHALTIARSLACHFDMPWGHQVFLDFFERELADADKDVDNDLYVGNIQDYIDDFLGAKNVVKVMPNKVPAIYVAHDDEFQWCWWHRVGTNFEHNVQGNGKGITMYDPWSSEGSSSVWDGYMVNQRIARLL